MEAGKKIVLNIGRLAALLIILNFIYVHVQLPLEKDELSPYAQLLDECERADVLYMGDCSDIYCKKEDAISTVHGYLSQKYPHQKIIALSDVGFQPNSFVQLMKALESGDALENKTIIVTLNMRAFAPHIIADRYYTPQINQALVLTDQSKPALYNRLKITFKEYEAMTHDQANQLTNELEMVPYKRHENLAFRSQFDWITHKDYTPEISSYLRDYAFELDEYNQRINDFSQIAEYARNEKVSLIFLMVPINYQLAEEYFGKDLESLIDENIQFIKDRFKGNSIKIYDRTKLLKAEYFIEEKSNSHLTDMGKSILAKSIEL